MSQASSRLAAAFKSILVLAVIALAACQSSRPPELAGRTPDATVTMTKAQAAFIGSGTGGSGTLMFRGQSYPFTVGGAGIGGIGASSVRAEGEVYGLDDVSRFAGTYGQVRAGFAFGTASAGQLWLQNSNGVIMNLRANRTGLKLSLGADAIVITMQQ